MRAARSGDLALWLIGAFKLVKAAILVVAALAATQLIGSDDVTETVVGWASHLHLRPEGRLMGRILTKVSGLDPRVMREARIGLFVYAALLLTEGIGLLLRQRWAEYFTVIMTGSLIPFEVYELVQHATLTRAAIIVVNAAVVVYLVRRLRRERAHAAR